MVPRPGDDGILSADLVGGVVGEDDRLVGHHVQDGAYHVVDVGDRNAHIDVARVAGWEGVCVGAASDVQSGVVLEPEDVWDDNNKIMKPRVGACVSVYVITLDIKTVFSSPSIIHRRFVVRLVYYRYLVMYTNHMLCELSPGVSHC